MATFKELQTQYDFSDDSYKQIFWANVISFIRTAPWGGSGGFTYNLSQVLKSDGTLDPNGQIVFNNMQLGFHKSSVGLTSYAADVSRDIGSQIIPDGYNDIVLLIETEKPSFLYDYVLETNRSNYYDVKPLTTYTKQEATTKFADYLQIKKITLYAGQSNIRQKTTDSVNRLSCFIKTMLINDNFIPAGANYIFTNWSGAYINTDLCVTMDLLKMITNPTFLQALTLYTNDNDLCVGVYESSSKITEFYQGLNPRILFKSLDDLNDYLNSFQIPFTYDINKASSTPIADLDDGYKPSDPTPGGSSKPGGGGGNFDNTSDVVEFPDGSTFTSIDTGFITAWNPTINEIKQLAGLLWSDDVIIQGLLNLFGNVTDAIVGLYYTPFEVAHYSDKRNIILGRTQTNVTSYLVSDQISLQDCGSLTINEYWGNALDYSPYTKIELFLPFIGMVSLNPDDVMNKTVRVRYLCDLITGSCIAFIEVNDSIMYTYQGSCMMSTPITSQNFSELTSSIISAGFNVGNAVATGGATIASDALTSAVSVLTAKAPIQRSGSLTGSSAMLGVRRPYLIITRPEQSIPSDYQKYRGFPSNITATLGDLSGYTEVEYIHLDGFSNATSTELEQIEQLLKEGVIL